jgi:hypothetical protein
MIEHPVSAFHTGASHPYPRKLLDQALCQDMAAMIPWADRDVSDDFIVELFVE